MLRPIINKKLFAKNFFKKFSLIRKNNPEFDKFLAALPNKTRVYVIGGFLRYISDRRCKTNDLDIIIVCSDAVLGHNIKNSFLKFKQNRMGGFKINLKHITLDVWNLKNHYGFKRSYARTELEAIARSSFYNFDSIVFDLKNKKLFCKYYNQCLKTGILDFTGIKRN